MNLEVNKKHKKANLSNLKNRNKIFSSIMATTLALTLYSGCTRTNDNTETQEPIIEEPTIEMQMDINTRSFSDVDRLALDVLLKSITEDNIVNVPDNYKKYIVPNSNEPTKEQITIDQLKNITSLRLSTLNLESPDELLWLNYCENLESLEVLVFTDDVLSLVYELPNLKNISILNYGNSQKTIDVESCLILKSPKLEYLKLRQINVENGLLEQLDQLKVLDIEDNSDVFLINYDFDYTGIDSLERIIISNPYSIAIHLDTNELNELVNKGVRIETVDGLNQITMLKRINEQIDGILTNLNIEQDSKDEQKIQVIIQYTLDSLQYSEKVTELVNDNNINQSVVDSFYVNGYLFGALEKDEQICGNYSSLISTLCDRVGIQNRIQISSSHAWNLVYINGDNYYIDATILDEDLPNDYSVNDMYQNEWYLKDPNEGMNHGHMAINIPDILTITEIEEPITFDQPILDGGANDISNKQYALAVNNKTYIVTAAVMIEILTSLGYAYKTNIKKEVEKNKTL